MTLEELVQEVSRIPEFGGVARWDTGGSDGWGLVQIIEACGEVGVNNIRTDLDHSV